MSAPWCRSTNGIQQRHLFEMYPFDFGVNVCYFHIELHIPSSNISQIRRPVYRANAIVWVSKYDHMKADRGRNPSVRAELPVVVQAIAETNIKWIRITIIWRSTKRTVFNDVHNIELVSECWICCGRHSLRQRWIQNVFVKQTLHWRNPDVCGVSSDSK